MSGRACRSARGGQVRAQHYPPRLGRLPRPFVHVRRRRNAWRCVQTVGASADRRARGYASLPQGSLARGRVLLSRPVIAYYDPIRQSRGHAVTSRQGRLYTAPSLCGHASATRETFPTFTAVPSTRAIDPTPAGSRDLSHCVTVRDARLPRTLSESPPASRRLCQPYLTDSAFRRCIVRITLRPVCLPRPPGWLPPAGVTCAPPGFLRTFVTPAFRTRRHRLGAGSQARWSNGKPPIVGTCTRQVTAASEAAPEFRGGSTDRGREK
jgi:hypothetical protein